MTKLLPHAESLNSPQVSWRTEHYNENNATITLEWSKETGASYNISVIPSPLTLDPEKETSGNTSQLTILYNISYDVMVLATLCGENMNVTVIDVVVNQPGESTITFSCDPQIYHIQTSSSLHTRHHA